MQCCKNDTMLSLESFNAQLSVIMNDFAKAVIARMNKDQSNVGEQQEELDALVDGLCVEAIAKILRIVELVTTATKQQHPPSIKDEETEELITDTNGIDEPCGSADEEPENAPDDGGTPPSSPPTQIWHQDHEYAQSPSPVSADENASSAAQNKKRKRKKMKKAEPMNHPCERCNKVFPSEHRLTEHHRKKHAECPTCGELFPGISKLIEHEITAHGIMPYKCDYCDKGFTHKGHRDVHVRLHTGEKTAQCDICRKAYASALSLKLHRAIHFDKSFVCDVCGNSFYHAGHLVRHKRVHAEVRPYRCPTCGKGFTQAENMASHQAAVHEKEKHLCSICGKSYTTRGGLKTHMDSLHSDLPKRSELSEESLITCEVCGKRFRQPSHYKYHKLTHSGEKPFRCHTCGKSYKTKQQVQIHMHSHTGETPYKCTVCDKTFNNPTSFIRHKSIHSGEMPYSCEECGKQFRLLSFLKQHEQTLDHKRRTSSHMASSENTDSSRPPSAAKRKKKVLKTF